MDRAVQRRADQVVHAGVRDHEAPAAVLLDVEHSRDENARRSDDGAAGLDQDPEGKTREVWQHGSGVVLRGQRRLARAGHAESSADIERLEGEPFADESARERRELPRGFFEGRGLQDLTADVRLNSRHDEVLQAPRPAEDLARHSDVHSELVVLQAGRDVGMGLRVDVRIDAQGYPRGFPLPLSRGVNLLHLALRLHVEREEARGDPILDFLVRLAHTREDNPVRGETRLETGAQLPTRDDVRSRAQLCQETQDGQIRIGLGRVTDQMRDPGEGPVEAAEVLLDGRPAVDIDGRPRRARDLRERHAVTSQDSFFAEEPRHGGGRYISWVSSRALRTSEYRMRRGFAHGDETGGMGGARCHPDRSEGFALVRISRFGRSRFFVAEPVPTLNGAAVTMTKADSSLRS